MADVMVYRGQSGLQRLRQGHAMQRNRRMAGCGPASVFSLTRYGFLLTSSLELIRRFTMYVVRYIESTSWSTSVWSPSIAISEKDGHVKVCAELPGLSHDEFWVELTQDGLIIGGERKHQQDEQREGMYGPERFCRSFMRTIPIPREAQVEKVKATFEHEILTVLVPLPPDSGESKRLWARIPGVVLERAQALN